MKILITGNPNYEGLCKGIWEAYNRNMVEFIGRHNGWDMNDAQKVANYAKDYDVFVNSLYGPDGQQYKILEAVYNQFEKGHIINISSTSVYWEGGYSPKNYKENKLILDGMSKKMSQDSCWGNSDIRVTNIAFGQLNSQSQQAREDGKNKISLLEAGKYVKWLIDQPQHINIHYVCMDPIQKA
jgi:NADP-dependent 3-hydroxy acid dehydrogenase YdfG